jgi:hypothetical protein
VEPTPEIKMFAMGAIVTTPRNYNTVQNVKSEIAFTYQRNP